jgi:ERF superfamily protein
MKTSESIKEIGSALVKAQTQIKAAIKEAQNPFFKNKYADLASIIEAVRMPLNGAGICFLQPASASEDGVIVETVLLHTSGEWISESLQMPVNKHDAQAVGSAITYGRRYGLQSLCGVPSEDDDGEAATKTVNAPKTTITPTAGTWESLSVDQQTHLMDIVDCVNADYELNGPASAIKLLEDETLNLSAEEKVAAWAKFDSKQRSSMKKAKTEAAIKRVTDKSGYASQP